MAIPAAAQLAALDTAIAAEPTNAELHYLRAALLAETGQAEAAQAGYLQALALDPAHFGALNDLGALLYRTDFRSAAQVAYAEAVRRHPDNPVGRINLANTLLADGQIEAARTEYAAALRLDPLHPDAHQGLANLHQHLGETERADWHRQQSYGAREIAHAPYQGSGDPCRVLILASAVGGNIRTRFLLPSDRFEAWILAVEAFTPKTALPAHDLVFNAVGDPDLAPEAPAAAARVLAHTDAPVINRPERVTGTGRQAVAARLADLPGVHAPRVRLVARRDLGAAAAEHGFPVLVRSPGYHTGQNFVRVERAEDLAAAAAGLPGEHLLLIEPLDARGLDGRWRKYRAMLVGGEIFPLHLAASDDWKVHYFTSAMAGQPDLRAEEAAFLADMAGVIGPVAMAALAEIAATLRLDYAGVDFGVGADGRLLLFEANAAMVVFPPGPEPIWDYRRAAVDRVLAAARHLMLRRAGHTPAPDDGR